jgi:glycosyltransferase involved in cell wall biosynthesis
MDFRSDGHAKATMNAPVPHRRTRAPLRILVVVHDFQSGGTERIALRLASRWAADGEKTAVICGNPTGPLKTVVSKDVELFTPAKPIGRSRFSGFAVAAFAARTARAFKPDVIFLPGNFHAGMAFILKLRLGRRGPAIVVKLSNMLRRPRRRRAHEAAFLAQLAMKTAFADHLVVMSPELLDEARRSLPWRAGRYSVVPEPVLSDSATPPRRAAAGDEPPLIVAAGRLANQKNFAALLTAVAQLDRPFNLIIYGEGPLRTQLEASIESLGLAERVTLAGYIDDLMSALSNARLFVLPSDYEGFPAVLIEALAAGVPVVTTDCSPAIAGIVAMAEGGIMTPVGDPATLAETICASLDRLPPDSQRLAASVDRFRIGPSAAAYRDLFRKLAFGRVQATTNHRDDIDGDARGA